MSGVGIQLFILYLTMLTFIWIGFHHEGFRGEIFESGIYQFSFSSFFAGYISALLYKMNNVKYIKIYSKLINNPNYYSLKGENWVKLIILSGIYFPVICFICLMGVNFFLHLEQSSGAVDVLTMIELFGIWFGISLPMNVIGCITGF